MNDRIKRIIGRSIQKVVIGKTRQQIWIVFDGEFAFVSIGLNATNDTIELQPAKAETAVKAKLVDIDAIIGKSIDRIVIAKNRRQLWIIFDDDSNLALTIGYGLMPSKHKRGKPKKEIVVELSELTPGEILYMQRHESAIVFGEDLTPQPAIGVDEILLMHCSQCGTIVELKGFAAPIGSTFTVLCDECYDKMKQLQDQQTKENTNEGE